ncbi:tRNA (N6-threonylcarbamoyladenosine(37)-N6)-methyltransferase TrmO [Pectinatus frisingensis]|uniref:tRNA (N6-threonylcarbamoyladenosine(37)-N6)-methyltransferase TrmO n=1 Tax=Pectinatus frisingensis TaxID=865 RepID=UPI0018C6D31F|nr:tRNA (N6-threonylcarbamoyladenosine(37)-N6)-methyltransferase TrmO [Pectinatus frisingensis]
MEITVRPIGLIESEFKNTAEIPRQSIYAPEKQARLKLLDDYKDGLQGLTCGSKILIIFYFHQSTEAPLLQKPCQSDKITGVFSIRSPHRPNHIGISEVKITKIENNTIYFTGIDMLDGTPVLDIKPVIS